ncbi:SdrD B-like domain-containing protein, partial [Mesorhizobium sp. B2-4-3]
SAETLTSGENDTTGNDFVNTQLGSISGTKWQDADGLASTTNDRTALAGWQITLHGDTNGDGMVDVTLTTTTDASGHYTFSDLKPGLYTTDETMQSGWFQVSGSSAETLTSGENDTTGNDFVNTQLGSIHGFKFEDMDANGKYDGSDTPMQGITIQLQGDVDGNGTIDTLTTVTDKDGHFSFENLRPGTYTVSELFTDGKTWAATVDHDGNGSGDATTTVTVLSGQELVAVSGQEGPLGTHTEVNVGNALTFGNHELGALGLTPGFWYNHEYVWDAPLPGFGSDNSNGGVDGKGVSLASKLAAAGTISAPDIANSLPGNLDVDGDHHKDLVFTDASGKSLVIEWDDAREIVGGANGTGGDKLGDFVRYAITTLLNEAGVPNFSAPAGMNANITDWLIANGGVTHTDFNGDGQITDADPYILNYNNATEPGKDGFTKTIKASSAAWQNTVNGVPSGAQIFADMNATTDGATGNNMMMSLNQSHVFTTQDEGDHFGILSSVLNYSGSYLQLHV